jgi:predicted RNase H-like HicB family nuclease
MENSKYLVVIEKAEDGSYGAYVPDLPGCAICGAESVAEAKQMIHEAIDFHIEGLREDGERMPEPAAQCEFMEPSHA